MTFKSSNTKADKKNGSTGKLSRKALVIIVCVALATIIGATAVVAYLSGKTGSVKNVLIADADPTMKVDETFDDKTVKSDVKVTLGKTDYTAYVRAAIVVNWVKTDDNTQIFHTNPVEDVDYTLQLANVITASGGSDLIPKKWTEGYDGFYYYTSPVVSEGSTAVLIAAASIKDGATIPEGYTLSVEIVAQAVQAIGTTDAIPTDDPSNEEGVLAVVDAWGVSTYEYGSDNIVLIYKPAPGSQGGPIVLPDDDEPDVHSGGN